MEDNICVICEIVESKDLVLVTKRGLPGLITASKKRSDHKWKHFEKKSPLFVHKHCRKTYTHPTELSKLSKTNPSTLKLLRSDDATKLFDFKRHCFLCKDAIDIQNMKKYKKNIHFRLVSTIEIKQSIIQRCHERKDKWSDEVFSRINNEIDLVAAEARYHVLCHTRFMSKVTENIPGRPNVIPQEEAFEKLCLHIENDMENCQFSINELTQIMTTFLPENEQCWSEKNLKLRLKKKYHDDIIISSISGKPSVLCFKGKCDKLLNKEWAKNKIENRKQIVIAAAKIIKEDIRGMICNLTEYPSTEEIQSGGADHFPESLQTFFYELVLKDKKNDTLFKKKVAAIENFIISLVRARSYISPVMFSMGVLLHRKYASRALVDILSSIGVSCSYQECLHFESCAIDNYKESIPEENFCQFVFDNADVNIRTIDGHGTFHSMGGIMCVTPKLPTDNSVIRSQNKILATKIGYFGSMPVQVYYKPSKLGLKTITMEPLEVLKPDSEKAARMVDTLWLLGSKYCFSTKSSWAGYMSTVKYDTLSIDSDVMPLPFINLDPSNLSTIHSALSFAAMKCKQYNKPCIVTFDQPLFLKAVDIVEAANSSNILSKVIIRLGGFHTLMSFMGSIGNIMTGCGIEELWGTVYSKNTIPHMISGHAYARSLRCHFLTHEALGLLICADINLSEDELKEIQSLYEQPTVADVRASKLIEEISENVEKKLTVLAETSRTGRLWVKYFKLVNILKQFIRAERSGNWILHIYCLKLMIPVFYATGHNNYAKSAHLYLQQMKKLQDINPAFYEKFVDKGMFTIRRSGKHWSGTWTDMVIEQNLMRAMKTVGGLTHGRGFSDSSIARWIAGMSVCVPIISAMEDFSGIKSFTSEQHVDLRQARKQRDDADLHKFLEWLKEHNPFKCKEFISIFSGLVAKPDINCDLFEEIGEKILNENVGRRYTDIQCKRIHRVKNFSQITNNAQIHQSFMDINPMQLFYRIICSNKSSEQIKDCFKFELSPYPLSLFKDGTLRKGQKSLLLKELDIVQQPNFHSQSGSVNVVDGGFFLHKVVWQKPATFQMICDQYVNYAKHAYGKQCVLVFDGYDSTYLSTKEITQNFRSKNATEIAVKLENTIITPQEEFLRNGRNKQKLIEVLKTFLDKEGIEVIQAERDADYLIVRTAVQLSNSGKNVTVVAEDTDIAILLIHHSVQNNIVLLRPGKAAKADKITNINNLQIKLGHLKQSILFLHAVSGCDTTSFIFKKSKKYCMQMMKKDIGLCNDLMVFLNPNPDRQILIDIGLKFITKLYQPMKNTQEIDDLRYTLYNRITSRQRLSSAFNLALLPPTRDAAEQHILRVYCQVQEWTGKNLNPLEYGWEKDKYGSLVPKRCRKDIAPQDILKMVFCNCKDGTCGKSCSCVKLGLKCSSKCGQCFGMSCGNTCVIPEDTEEENCMFD